MSSTATFTIGYVANIGQRRRQEDAYALEIRPRGLNAIQRKGALFVVADGVSGRGGGDVASSLAVNSIKQRYYSEPGNDVISALRSAFTFANNTVIQNSLASDKSGMATTAVCAVIRGDELYVAHVGDSRAYLLRGHELEQVTQDHSFVAEQVANGLMTDEDARNSDRRNVITRSIGFKPRIEPDARFVKRLENQDRLLLCTDGLYDVLESRELASGLQNRTPQESGEYLVDLALRNGSTDNMMAVVVEVQLSVFLDAVAGEESALSTAVISHTQTQSPPEKEHLAPVAPTEQPEIADQRIINLSGRQPFEPLEMTRQHEDEVQKLQSERQQLTLELQTLDQQRQQIELRLKQAEERIRQLSE